MWILNTVFSYKFNFLFKTQNEQKKIEYFKFSYEWPAFDLLCGLVMRCMCDGDSTRNRSLNVYETIAPSLSGGICL